MKIFEFLKYGCLILGGILVGLLIVFILLFSLSHKAQSNKKLCKAIGGTYEYSDGGSLRDENGKLNIDMAYPAIINNRPCSIPYLP